MKKVKPLITGGTGFVGANLVRRMVSEGIRPTLLVRENHNPWRIRDIINSIDVIETDLLSLDRLKQDLNNQHPTHLFHLAVYGAYQGVQREIAQTFETNIFSTINLLSLCTDIGIEYFINTGSSSEYGLRNTPMQVGDPVAPVNYYGVSKVATSLLTKVYAQQNKLPAVTLRLFSPYGYFEDQIRFASTVILALISKKEVKLSNPNYVRDFIFIDDVIDAYMHFLDGNTFFGNIFNVGSGTQTSLSKFVHAASEIAGVAVKTQWSNHAPNQMEPEVWKANIEDTKNKLHWAPTNTLEQGIKKMIEWYRKNYHLYD